MDIFQLNIQNIYGQRGIEWLRHLPKLIENTALRFGLSKLTTINNLSYNYIASGFQGNKPIVLKLSIDNVALKREAFMLKCFKEHGAVAVLVEDSRLLILERAIPGFSLREYFPNKDIEAIKIACDMMKKLHQAEVPKHIIYPTSTIGFLP